ncbi:MAG: endo-1,4-beta-xylanase [Acetatifactor sp.]
MRELKKLYSKYFKIGVACEKINERNQNNEIGNPDKEKLILQQFNSLTFGNELKPAYNMGVSAPGATEENLPFVINPAAKAMLDWAGENGMPVRGHVLVWHSQCPKEIFCKGYQPVTIPTDPEILAKNPMMKYFEKLDPVCYVDRETMLKRLRSYIFSVMEYMYANGYAETIYAWDVVNEAIETADGMPGDLRDSYWYQVIGGDFIYWAFRYTRDAVREMSVKYASLYGVSAEDEEALATIRPALFYNDYNEWMADRKRAVLAVLNQSSTEHGSILGEGLIDGIGMQGHLSDNNDINEYMAALREYAGVVREVQITELDVKCTCTNANAEYYQAAFYKRLFEELIKAKEDGVNITAVVLWGLTDDNSWIRGANPLLFRGDLSCKKSYDALVYAVTGEDLGEPEQILCDLSDRMYDFEVTEGGEVINPENLGFRMRGFGEMELCQGMAHSGSRSLANERRFGDWCGISYDASDFIGQTVELGAWVSCTGQAVEVIGDFGGEIVTIASKTTGTREWLYINGTVKIPANLHSAVLVFLVKDKEGDISPLYLDDMTIRLIGQEESFEEKQHIAAIRGAGHLPFLTVVDYESRDGQSHSLLVTRQEKDATVKFPVSSYIGHTITVTAFVKTADKVIRMGLDGAVSMQWAQVDALPGEWTGITATAELPGDLRTAEIYLETDGNADFFVDDFFVERA